MGAGSSPQGACLHPYCLGQEGPINRVAISSHTEYSIPLSPLVKQHRIMVEFERRLSAIEELEDTVEAYLNRPDGKQFW